MGSYPYYTAAQESQIVYVRRVARDALPSEMRDETSGMDEIYSISTADGQMLALLDDRKKAFVVARMNEKLPVSVH